MAAVVAVTGAISSRRIHNRGQPENIWITPPRHTNVSKNWNYCHTHSGNVDNEHTSRMYAKPGPAHNPHATRTNMMNGLPAGLHKTILPLASGRMPHVLRQQRSCAPASWQQPLPPINFTNAMVPMMPPVPYHQMHYMGQQFRLLLLLSLHLLHPHLTQA